MTCGNWRDTFFSEVSFCVFHLFCFVRCYSLPVPHPIPRSLSSFLIVLHCWFFPWVFNTVLEVKHAVLFQQFLLNLNSHMNLKGHCVLGLILLFMHLQSYSHHHFVQLFSPTIFLCFTSFLLSCLCAPHFSFHCSWLLRATAGTGIFKLVSRDHSLFWLLWPLFDLCLFQFNEEIIKLWAACRNHSV